MLVRPSAQPVAVPSTLSSIPTLSREEHARLFDASTYMTRSGYLYDAERAIRHMDAMTHLQGLYHTGAMLINNGTAYQPSNLIAGSVSESVDEVNPDSRQSLITYYSHLAQLTATTDQNNRNARPRAVNPLHALFVIKVALDHLPAEMIIKLANDLEKSTRLMTFNLTSVHFPNHSTFSCDQAINGVMQEYIANNMQRFQDPALLQSAQALSGSSHRTRGLGLYSITCNTDEAMQEKVNTILQLTPQTILSEAKRLALLPTPRMNNLLTQPVTPQTSSGFLSFFQSINPFSSRTQESQSARPALK